MTEPYYKDGRGMQRNRVEAVRWSWLDAPRLPLTLVFVALGAFVAADAAAQGLTLSVSRTTLAETAGSTDVTVTATLSAARTVSTTVTLSLGGTAASTDYGVQETLPDITIPANQTSAEATLIVSPVDDALYEGDETIAVNGAAAGLVVTGASLTLTDSETPPTVAYLFGVVTDEGVGPRTLGDFVRLNGAAFEDDVEFTLDIAAEQSHGFDLVSADDYTVTPTIPATITLPAGQLTIRLDLVLSIVDDDLVEPFERLDFELSGSYRGETFSPPSKSSLRIRESDQPTQPSVEVSRTGPRQIYAGETSSHTYNITGIDIADSVEATISWSSTLADWTITPRSSTVTIGAGDTTQSVTFTITPPATASFQAYVTPQLDTTPSTPISGYLYLAFEVMPITAPTVRRALRCWAISPDFLPIAGDRLVCQVDFNRGFVLLSGNLTVTLDSGPVVIPCGKDGLQRVQCTHRIRVGDYDLDGVVSIAAGALSFEWRDDRDPDNTWPEPRVPATAVQMRIGGQIYGGRRAFDFHVSPQTLQEGVGATSVTVRAVNAERLTAPTPTQVPFAFAGGTASAADYVVTGDQTVTIPAGELEGSATVMFTPVDDGVRENRVETVRIEAVGSDFARSAELRILDGPTIVLSVSPATVTEDGGAQQVVVTAVLGSAEDQVRPRAIPVSLTLGGSAVEGDDFTVSGTRVVTIPAGERSGTRTLTLTPVDDRLLEMDETIEVHGSTPGLTVSGTSLTLEDDEVQPQVVLSVDEDTLLESETGGKAVQVTARLDPSVMVSADVVTTLDLGGSATEGAGGDYTGSWSPATRQITVPAGSNTGTAAVTLSLSALQDNLAEGVETIVVEGVADVQNPAMDDLSVQVATIELQDDDVRGVVVSPTRLTIGEGGSKAYTVRLTTEPSSDVMVSVSAPSDAPLGVEPLTLTFTADNWSTEQSVTVTVADDLDAVMHEDVELTHSVGGGGYDAVTAAPVLVTLRETTVPQMTIADGTADEAAGSLAFEVTIDAVSSAEVRASWATAGVTATAGADYTESSGTVVFAPGTTSQTVTVPLLADDLDEVDETFTVTLSAPEHAELADAEATGTITDDDDAPALTLSAPASAATEGDDDNLAFTVTLAPASGREVTVSYATSDGTAVSPADFTAAAGDASLTFAPGETTKTVTVPIVDDTLDEDDETFTVTLSDPTDATVAAGSATGTIADDDDPPELGVEDVAASEDAGNLTFTVTLAPASGRAVTVSYATSDGTAAQPGDYAATSGTLTFAAGVTEQEVEVAIVDDAVDEEDETLTFTLSGAQNATLAGGGTTLGATGTIEDDDVTPTASVSDVRVSEDAGTLTFTVTLDVASGLAASLSYATSDDTATAPDDYAATSGTLAFAAGDTEGTVEVPIVDDAVDEEEEETFTLTLSGASNVLLAGDAEQVTATGTIVDDDDPAVEVSFGSASYTASEGGSAATVTVQIDVDPEREVTVPLTTAHEGGATAADYSGVPTEVVFTAGGALFQTFDVEAVDDAVDDDGESVVLGFGSPLPAGVTETDPDEATVELSDDDQRGVRASETAVSVNENESTSYTVVLESAPTEDVTVTVTGSDGTDLTSPAEGLELRFTAENWSTPQTVTVTAADDTDVLADAPVDLTHTVAGGDYGFNSVPGPVVTVTIVENDTATLSVTDASAAEDAGQVAFTVTLSEASTATVTVDYATSDGTAVEPDDYTSTSGTLTFTVPETSKTLQVPVVDDEVDEDEEETFTLTLSNVAQAGLAGGATTLAVTGTIVDDDDPAVAVSFGSATYSVSEAGAPVTVTVSLDKDPEREVVIPLTATPGNGAVAADYTVSATAVTFTAGGALSQTFTLAAVDDEIDDDGETVALGFGTLPARVTSATPESATVTITDDDTRGVTVSETELTIREGESGSYTVVLGSAPTATVTVTVNGSDGTHLTAPAEGRVLTFTAQNWNVPQTVTVTAQADADAVVPPDVELTHTVAGGDYAGASAGSVTVRTTELTVPELTLSPSAATVSEGVGGAGQTFAVALSVASSETVTVAHATSDGTAASGADYTATSGTLTFSPGGVLTQTFSVPILGDALDEDDETFTVSLSAPVQATVGSGAATVTITDDDALPAVNLPSGFVVANEGDGSLTVTVSLSAASGREVSVSYASSDRGGPDAATAGEDYGAVSGTLRFAPGSTTQTFSVSITDDTLDERSYEEFDLVLSEPVNAVLGSVSRKRTRIVDNDDEPTLDLSPTAVDVVEGGAVTFTAELSAASALPVNFLWETSDGTAVAPGDYTSSNGRVPLRIPPGETSRTFLVSTTDDGLDEEDTETFGVRIRASGMLGLNATLGDVRATVTVTDNDAPPAFSVADVRVREDAGSLVFTVRLDGASAKEVTVGYAVTEGTATAGVDYTAVAAGTLTFAAGTTEQTVTVPVLDDAVHEPDETLTLTLSGPTNAALADASATGTIANDEATPVVSLGLDPSSVAENGGASAVTAALSGASSETVTVTVTSSAVSPAVAADFTQSGTTLTIAAGSTVSTGTVTVTAVDNDVDAPDKTVTVSGSVTSGLGVSAPLSQDLTITDDEVTPTVALVLTPSSIRESGGVSVVTATLSGRSSLPITVEVSAEPGTGAAADDFTLVGSSLVIAAGSTTSTGVVTLTAVDNPVDAPDKTVRVTGAVTSGSAEAPAEQTLTITDDEATPTVSLVLTPSTVGENGGVSVVTATLSGASGAAVTVTVTAQAVSPAVSGDFTQSGTTLTIAAGSTTSTGTVTLTAVNNAVDSPNKTVRVSGSATGGHGVSAPSSQDLTIADDEATPTVSLVLTPSMVGENGGVSAVTATLSGVSSAAVTVTVTAQAVSPAVAADFTQSGTTLTIAAGATASTGTVTLTAVDNAVDSPNKVVRVSGSVTGGLGVSAPSSQDLTIADDEGTPTLMLVLTPTSVGENGGISTVTATLNGASSAAVTVTVSATAVSPAVAADFTQSGTTLTIDAGSTTSTGTVTLTAVNNDVDAPDKTVRVSASVSGGLGVSAPLSQDLTITDDEATPTVSLVLTPTSVGENGGVSAVTATLSGASSAAVTVTVSATAVSPAVAADFTQGGTTLTISAGSTTSTGTVTLTAVNNDVDAPDKTVRVSASVSGGLGVSAPLSQDLTITDDEATPTVSLVLTPASVGENGGISTVTATLNGASSAAVTVTVSAAAVSPAVAADFTQSGTTLTISAGSTTSTGTVTLTAVNNDVDAPNRTIRVSASVSGGLGVSAPSSQDLTITDDEGAPTVSLVLTPSTIGENGGSSVVTATLSGASSVAVTVTVSAAAVSPAVAADFTQSGTTLTISAGSTTSTGTVTLTAVNNDVDAPNRTIRVSASVSGGLGVSAPSSQDLTITDDEGAPTVSLVLTPSTIGENGGSSVVTATLSGASSVAVTVTVSAAAVSPAVAADFTQSGTTLTIAAGSTTSTGTVTLTAVNNDVDAPNRTIRVSASVSGGLGVSAPSSQDLTITDDEGAPTVSLVLTPSTIGENGGSSVVTATLSGASSAAVTVTVSAAAVSPAVAADFTQSGTTLTIAAGSTTSTGTVTLTAVNNDVDAPNRTIRVSASVSGGLGVSAPSSQDLTITDDEGAPTVSLVLTPSTIGENGGVSVVTATLSGASSAAVTVTVSAAAVSPAVAADFTQSGATLTIAAGSTTSTGTVTLTAVNNDVDAPNRTIRVSASVSGGLGVSAPSSQDLTITDDEGAPTVSLVLTPSTIGENGGVSVVTATLSSPSSEAVTVTVSATAVSPAVAGDFTQSGTTLTVAAGATTSTGTVTLTAVNNDVDAPNRTIRVSASVSGGLGVPAPASQDLTITDDEGAPTVALVLTPASIGENGGSSTVTATLSSPSSEAVTVTVSATAVSPAVAGDFTQSGTTLTIAAAATTSTGTVTIAAVNNQVDSLDKTVRVSGSVTGGLGVSAPSSQDLTITDDEGAPTVALVLTPSTIGENGGVSAVTATLSGASSAAVTVTVTAAPVSPAMVADFTQSGTTLTIAVGATTSTGTVTLTAVDNEVDAPNKVVRVTGSVTGGLGVSAPSPQELTITRRRGRADGGAGADADVDRRERRRERGDGDAERRVE